MSCRDIDRTCCIALAIAMCSAAGGLTGCVRRTISISSDPPGALLTLNGREIGRTPVDVDFLYYGDYDVQLTKEGYEPLLTNGVAEAPWWDSVPVDLFAEMTKAHAQIAWHYELQPEAMDRPPLIERARSLRERVEQELPAPSMPAAPSVNEQADRAERQEP